MSLSRWLLVSAALCATVGAGTLALALCCILDLIDGLAGPCELWLLGPLIILPLGLGLGLIGRAASRPADGEGTSFPPAGQ